MSARKPVCKRFLKGECNASNCNFFHPKKKDNSHHQKATHQKTPHNNAKKPEHRKPHNNIHTRTHVVHETVSEPVEESDGYNSDDYLLPYEIAMRDAANYEIIRPTPSRNVSDTYVQQTVVVNPVVSQQPVVTVQQPVTAKPGTFGAKLMTAKFAFDKAKFETWLNNDMPNVDSITIINLFCKLMKKTEPEIINHITNTNIIIPDVMALIAHGLTNKKWLKELHGRFLGNSYTGLKTFNMKTIKDLLTFSIVQIYQKTQTQDFKNSEHMICLYVCIMRLIGKIGILIDIDSIDIIEKNYNNNMYDMVCIV